MNRELVVLPSWSISRRSSCKIMRVNFFCIHTTEVHFFVYTRECVFFVYARWVALFCIRKKSCIFCINMTCFICMATIPESEPACAMFACGFCAHAKEKKMHIQKNVTRGSYTKKCTSPCVYKIFDIQVCIQKKLTHLRVYKTKVKFQIFFSKMFASIQKSCTPPGVYKKQHRCFSIQKKVTPYTKKCHEINSNNSSSSSIK